MTHWLRLWPLLIQVLREYQQGFATRRVHYFHAVINSEYPMPFDASQAGCQVIKAFKCIALGMVNCSLLSCFNLT